MDYNFNKAWDSLDESKLTEAYKSQAAPDEPSRKAAEDAFKAELVNGPEVEIYSQWSRKNEKVKIGSFDRDLFHKAFDAQLEADGMLDIFGGDGKLIARNVYGAIKDYLSRDRKCLAAKYLMKLWVAQFKDTEKDAAPFTDVKAARDAKAKADAEAKAKADAEDAEKEAVWIDENNAKYGIVKELEKKLSESSSIDKLKKLTADIAKAARIGLKLDDIKVRVAGIEHLGKDDKTIAEKNGKRSSYKHKEYVWIRLFGSVFYQYGKDGRIDVQVKLFADDTSDLSIASPLDSIVKDFEGNHLKSIIDYDETLLKLLNFQEEYYTLGLGKLIKQFDSMIAKDDDGNLCRVKCGKSSFYFERDKYPVYYLLASDSIDSKDFEYIYDPAWEPVAVMVESSSDSNYSGTYNYGSEVGYFSSKYADELVDAKYIEFIHDDQGVAPSKAEWLDAEPQYRRWFDKKYVKEWSVDSSD